MLCAGCSTPRTASGTLSAGRRRVEQLVADALHALPSSVQYDPPRPVSGTQPCRKSVAGYVIGTTGAHRAEAPAIVKTPAGRSAPSFLPLIEHAWRAAGYRIDTSRLGEKRFPQVKADTPDGYHLVATAFGLAPQIDLYAVSQCLRGR